MCLYVCVVIAGQSILLLPLIGSVEVDLSNYVTVSNLETTLLDYVEKEVGKGLSTNDYTNTDKKVKFQYRPNILLKKTKLIWYTSRSTSKPY